MAIKGVVHINPTLYLYNRITGCLEQHFPMITITDPKEVFDAPLQENGSRVLKNGNVVTIDPTVFIGKNVTLGGGIRIGPGVKLFDGCTLENCCQVDRDTTIGSGVTVGKWAHIHPHTYVGDNTTVGSYATIHRCCSIGPNSSVGINCSLFENMRCGMNCKFNDTIHIGPNVTLDSNVTSEQLNLDFIEAYKTTAKSHVFWKWVKPNRMSPCEWVHGHKSLEYLKDATIMEPNTKVSDQQCGVGLHVFRIGYRPEFAGLTEPGHNWLCLRVRVNSNDICFAGLPGNDCKLRVKKLKVLD